MPDDTNVDSHWVPDGNNLLASVIAMSERFSSQIADLQTRGLTRDEQLKIIRFDVDESLRKHETNLTNLVNERLSSLDTVLRGISDYIKADQEMKARQRTEEAEKKLRAEERDRIMSEISAKQDQQNRKAEKETLERKKVLREVAENQQKQTQWIVTLLSTLASGTGLIILTRFTDVGINGLIAASATLIVLITLIAWLALRRPIPKLKSISDEDRIV